MNKNEPMAVVFSSSSFDGELEAMAIKSVLDANDIPAILSGPHILPNLPFQIEVPAHLFEKAEQVIRDSRQDGRRSADEGERLTER